MIGLIEIWQRPQDLFVLPLQCETVNVPPVGQQWGGHKGVALAPRHTVNYKREDTSIMINTMYATVKIKDLYMTVLYAAPQTLRKELTNTLNQIRKSSRGSSILMGDLNARHKNWDTKFNTAGTTLLRWANLRNWVIQAANLLSFHCIQVLSNIVLFITRGIRVTEITVQGRRCHENKQSPPNRPALFL